MAALSPDDVVLELRGAGRTGTDAAVLLEAQQISDATVDNALTVGRSVLVETVLSSRKFETRVESALRNGFEFGFAFVTVSTPELNVDRVKDRVVVGGHDVPEDRIRARRARAHDAVSWFAAQAHVGVMFDNSGQQPRLLAEKRRDREYWDVFDGPFLDRVGLSLRR